MLPESAAMGHQAGWQLPDLSTGNLVLREPAPFVELFLKLSPQAVYSVFLTIL